MVKGKSSCQWYACGKFLFISSLTLCRDVRALSIVALKGKNIYNPFSTLSARGFHARFPVSVNISGSWRRPSSAEAKYSVAREKTPLVHRAGLFESQLTLNQD